MPNELIAEEVDIFQCPVIDVLHLADKGAQITLGDAHANAMKLLFLLVKHGIAKNMDEDKYKNFVTIYLKSFEEHSLAGSDLFVFSTLLASIEFSFEGTLRLIGDLLADRGGHDYLILLILKRLLECGVSYEILLSNHDFAFISNFEDVDADFFSSTIYPCYSMQRLEPLLLTNQLPRADLNTIVSNAYLPYLKLISYTVNEDNSSITIYSHAPIGLLNIAYLAAKFEIPFDDTSVQGLSTTIDILNGKFFHDYVCQGRITDLVGKPLDNGGTYDPASEPVGYVIWNRDCKNIFRPRALHGYSLQFVYGHHIDETSFSENPHQHIYGLDNQLGKTIPRFFEDDAAWDHQNEELYTALYSHERGCLQAGFSTQPVLSMSAVVLCSSKAVRERLLDDEVPVSPQVSLSNSAFFPQASGLKTYASQSNLAAQVPFLEDSDPDADSASIRMLNLDSDPDVNPDFVAVAILEDNTATP